MSNVRQLQQQQKACGVKSCSFVPQLTPSLPPAGLLALPALSNLSASSQSSITAACFLNQVGHHCNTCHSAAHSKAYHVYTPTPPPLFTTISSHLPPPHTHCALSAALKIVNNCCVGLCCGVDQAVNRMLPAAMRSSRPTNFFKQLCVESTGTASFTMFAPIGQVTNATAFHQETKKRRSWNCGSGDFIVQPVASASNVRLVKVAQHGTAWVLLIACAAVSGLLSSTAWHGNGLCFWLCAAVRSSILHHGLTLALIGTLDLFVRIQ